MQAEYNLKKVGEQGIDIGTKNFDASNSKVMTTFFASNLGKEMWGPTKTPDVNWNEEKRVFQRVSKL